MKYLNENNIITSLHIGGLAGMSAVDAIEIIHEKLLNSRLNNVPSILISIDQTSAFTMIEHKILIKKLEHIGFNFNSLNLMKSYLNNRTQRVSFNGSISEELNIGDKGCFQGSLMATLLYIIYVLDQPSIAHLNCDHLSNNEENEDCTANLSINYIDDNMSEIIADKWNYIERNTEIFLNNQLQYHINNKLTFNNDKTIVMFNSKVKKNKKKIIRFKNKNLIHSNNIIMLGIIYNDKLNFKDHIKNGNKKKKSLIKRIKQKINLIKNIKYWMSKEELKLIANVYINGILNYGLQMWSKESFKFIDQLEN